MLKKIYLISTIFLFLTNCGYTPIHSNKSNQNINIEILDYSGDSQINSVIKSRLTVHKNNENAKLFKVTINTTYEKIDLVKDIAGNIENYDLKAISVFKVKRGNLNKTFTVMEKFTMANFSDDFEEKNYEKKIKENFAVSIYQKFISRVLQIK